MIKIKFKGENLMPSKAFLINAGTLIISTLLVRFVFDSFGFYMVTDRLPLAIRYSIIIAIGVYLKSLFDLNIKGRDYF